jgi:hypothetical protein
VKNRVKLDPRVHRTINALSPIPSVRDSRYFSGNSRLSAKKNVQSSANVTRKYDLSFRRSGAVDTTKSSDVTLSTKPRILACESGAMNIATTGIDSLISFFMRSSASSDEVLFLSIAKESNVDEAIFWAKEFGLKYKRALSKLMRLQSGPVSATLGTETTGSL